MGTHATAPFASARKYTTSAKGGKTATGAKRKEICNWCQAQDSSNRCQVRENGRKPSLWLVWLIKAFCMSSFLSQAYGVANKANDAFFFIFGNKYKFSQCPNFVLAFVGRMFTLHNNAPRSHGLRYIPRASMSFERKSHG